MPTNSKEKKPKKKRLCGKKKKIYDSLKEQLLLNDNYNDYTEDLLQDYLTMYEVKSQLALDIENNGISIEYDNGGGQRGRKGNSSIDLLNRTNAQMLKLLDSLGLKPTKMKKTPKDPDDDDIF